MKRILSGLLQYKDGNEWKDIHALDGRQGDKGDTGATPNLSIGTVTELLPTDEPTATLTGTTASPVLNLGIPKGDTGEVTEEELVEMLVDKADVICDTASGAIATFTDGANNALIKQLTINIIPYQSRVGTPSPSTPKAISGHTSIKLHRTGKNLLGGTDLRDEIQTNYPGINYDEGGQYLYAGSANISGKVIVRSLFDYRSEQFTTMFTLLNTSKKTTNMRFVYTDTTATYLSNLSATNQKELDVSHSNSSKTLNSISGGNIGGTTYIYYMESGIFLGSQSASDYEAYKGQTYTINLPQEAGTVYGGTLTINEDGSGVLTVTDANIASYNGETLPSTWISSMDVYAEGTTPTTGAQVVYKLAEPIVYNLTAQQVITTLQGINNIWANTGDVSVTYRADTKLYIDKKVASLV